MEKKIKIGVIGAINENGVYAVEKSSSLSPRDNGIPWDIPKDFKNFAKVTKGNKKNAVVMGRITKEMLPFFLKERINIILTSKDISFDDGSTTAKSVEEAIKKATELNPELEEIWFIGGKEIWEEALKIADVVMLTVVEKEIPDSEKSWKCEGLLLNNLEEDFHLELMEDFSSYKEEYKYSMYYFSRKEN